MLCNMNSSASLSIIGTKVINVLLGAPCSPASIQCCALGQLLSDKVVQRPRAAIAANHSD